MSQRILFLGAARFQMPPIEYAIRAGYQVITCDNRPSNPGHRLAHKTFDVSVVDILRILEIARSSKIDGILSFGSDVAAPTAAAVAKELGLPGNTPASIETLTDKARFRECLRAAGIQDLPHREFAASEAGKAATFVEALATECVLKPVDAAGSKGVRRVRTAEEVRLAFEYALGHSRAGRVLVEGFIARDSYQICGDAFVIGGRVVHVYFGDGYFYPSRELLAPYAESFPSRHSSAALERLKNQIQAAVTAAGFERGPINIDALVTPQGAPFLIEIGPRSGGNFIPSAIALATQVDVVGGAVECVLDPKFQLDTSASASPHYFASYMMHSMQSGTFGGFRFAEEIRANIFGEHPYIERGAPVTAFREAGTTIGNVLLRFDSIDEMRTKMERMPQLCEVILA